MRNSTSRMILPIGISVLALFAMAGPMAAQDETAQKPGMMTPTDPAASAAAQNTPDAEVPPVAAKVIDAAAAEPAAERKFDDSIDPVVREAVQKIDGLGVISQHARIGEDILIIDREVARAEAIKRLIAYLGVEGFRAKYPDLAAQMASSPVLLEADLAQVKLQNDIEVAKRGPEAPKEVAAPAPRDDGSNLFDGPTFGMPSPAGTIPGTPAPADAASGVLDPALTEMIAAAVKKSTAEAIAAEKAKDSSVLQVNLPISLREVYGTSGALTAVITHGGERIRVRAGDTLPNNTTVEKVEQDSITLFRNGALVKIEIRG